MKTIKHLIIGLFLICNLYPVDEQMHKETTGLLAISNYLTTFIALGASRDLGQICAAH